MVVIDDIMALLGSQNYGDHILVEEFDAFCGAFLAAPNRERRRGAVSAARDPEAREPARALSGAGRFAYSQFGGSIRWLPAWS
jgi:hypothetical protein